MYDTKALMAAFVQALTDDDFESFAAMLAECVKVLDSLQRGSVAAPTDTVTMLDDFAMSSLTGLLISSVERAKSGGGDTADVTAEKAYNVARAMMAQRKRIVLPPSVVLQAIEFPTAASSEFPTVEAVLENLKKGSGSQEPV